MDLCASIKVNHTLFVAFPKYNTFTLGKIDVLTIKQDHLSNTHTCWS